MRREKRRDDHLLGKGFYSVYIVGGEQGVNYHRQAFRLPSLAPRCTLDRSEQPVFHGPVSIIPYKKSKVRSQEGQRASWG